MITFGVDGEHITISINTGFNIAAPVITLRWSCGNELLARALLNVVSRRLARTMQRVRMEAYDLGWKHAKAKARRWDTLDSHYTHLPKTEDC